MIQNIFVGLMAVAMIVVGVWGWWLENGRPEMREDRKDKIVTENMEVGNDCHDRCENKKESE